MEFITEIKSLLQTIVTFIKIVNLSDENGFYFTVICFLC